MNSMALTATLVGTVIALLSLVIAMFWKTYDSGKLMGALQERINACEKTDERLDAEIHGLRVKSHEIANDVSGISGKEELQETYMKELRESFKDLLLKMTEKRN